VLALNFWGRGRVPVMLQTEAAECGLACLAMAASYHGYVTDLASLRRRFPLSLKGVNLQQLIEIGKQIKFASRPLRGEIEELPAVKLPAVLHWDLNHFVVLTGIARNRFVVNDPACGEVVMTRDEFSRHFTGVVLELSPTGEFEHKVEKQRFGVWDFWRSATGLGGALTQILVLALVLELFAIAAPLYQQWVVDEAIVSGDRDLLVVLAIGFGLLLVIQSLVSMARSWALLYLGTTLNVQLVRNLFAHLLRLPMEFFEKRHLGDINSRFGSLDVIQHTLTTSFLASMIDGVMVIAMLALMLVYSVALSFISIFAIVIYGLLRVAIYRRLRAVNEEVLVRGAKQQTNFLEAMRGMQAIKLFGREAQRQAVYQNLLVDRTNSEIVAQKIGIAFQFANLLIFGIENIAVIYFGARLVLDGGFSVGMLFAFLSYKTQFGLRTSGLVDKWVEIRMLNLHAERVADIALTPPEQAGAMAAERPAGARIDVRGLSFRYAPLEKAVLENVDLEVAPGEIVAITGPSGCGKSTLMKVMLGLLKPEQGAVLIGGQDIRNLDPASYRGNIGAVMQDDTLFAGSIFDNITFFDAAPDHAGVAAAASLASIAEDIARMPMQYDTLIGNMGSALSGGQRQRVILARALYRQPKILFLDEATSHVDVAQEKAINEALQQLGITIILIAHRPETIRSASRVYDLIAAR
jgi:ATP-binding cassette, subfamily B, bacterial CvaB/MchF/RaxB